MRINGVHIGFILFAFLCIAIGFYPVLYLLTDEPIAILLTKSPELLADSIWNIAFYGHIIGGGIALLSGWSQFSGTLRKKYQSLHRSLGKIYVSAVLISSICAIYLAFYATTGWIASMGFGTLGVIWLTTTLLAYSSVRNGNIQRHQKWMIYSYAACFAAVTLRIWLPLLSSLLGSFEVAYPIVSWLCWVPNIIVADVIARKIQSVPPVGTGG